MSGSSVKSAPCIGFLTAIEHADLGLLGGYLVLNPAGRPLEFHCTAPVKANKTQQILYGPTLAPYLYGEQIGQALVNRSHLGPLVVCTDQEAMLAAREHVQVPLVRVLSPADSAKSNHAALPIQVEQNAFALGASTVLLPAAFRADEARIRAAWPAQADTLDLAEPFARIREALEEAQQGARQAA